MITIKLKISLRHRCIVPAAAFYLDYCNAHFDHHSHLDEVASSTAFVDVPPSVAVVIKAQYLDIR